MKRINLLIAVLTVGVALGLVGNRVLSAQDNLNAGTVLHRTVLKGATGWEAILVQGALPPGAESDKHTQSGNYNLESNQNFERFKNIGGSSELCGLHSADCGRHMGSLPVSADR